MILESGVWSVMQSLKVDEFIACRTSYDSILRKFMPRSRAYKHAPFEYPVTDRLKLVLDRRDYSQWRIFAGGLRVNTRIFQYLKVNPFSFTMIDIGANIGAFSALFSKEIDVDNYNVHLFEPNPYIFDSLTENIKRLQNSNLSVNPYLNFYGLGEKAASLSLKINENHSGVSTLGNTKRPFTKTADVKVISLDEYAATVNLNQLDFLKIDVEAFEPGVLKGAAKTLEFFKPVLYFEYGKEWFGNFTDEYISEVIYFLKNLGYTFLREGRDGTLHPFLFTNSLLREYNHLNILGVVK